MYAIIGYIASAFLAISLLVNNALQFRWFNTLGNIAFIVYGMVIHAFPVLVANSILLCINIYQLIKLYHAKETFEMVAVTAQDELVKKFVSFYHTDINQYFPHFSFESVGNKIGFVVLRDLSIANFFMAQLKGDGTAVVEINYTVARYRDYQVGRFIFEREKEYLLQRGIRKIVYHDIANKNHRKFLEVMGFKQENIDGKTLFVKYIS